MAQRETPIVSHSNLIKFTEQTALPSTTAGWLILSGSKLNLSNGSTWEIVTSS